MKIIFIREIEETCDIVKRIIIKLKKFFNNIKIENTNGNIVYNLPIYRESKISKYRIKKICNKINKLLERDGVNAIVLSKYLGRNELLKNYLYSKNIHILNGRYLFKCLTYETLEYIYKVKNIKMEFGEVSLLVNDFTDINKEIIIHIAKNIKRLNIVTNHIEKYKKIEEYLYNEFGIMLNISNNKRRSLLKSEVIINIDFPQELINKYRIYDKAIIVNLSDKINLQSKRFNGINVNYYKIQIPDEYVVKGFKNEIIYESLIYGKKYKDVNEQLVKDEMEISKLIGNNGTIKENEFI